MKRPYLLLLLFCVILSSCEEQPVELSREYLVQGNWEQYMVTEKYYDVEGNLQDIVQKSIRKSVKVSKDKLEWNNHSDSYALHINGRDAALHQNCSELPQQNKVEGVSNQYPDWMSWTGERANVSYNVGGASKIASRVETTLEFRRINLVK